MNKGKVFMFSGQGTQYYGMGRELFDSNPIFNKWMTKLDSVFKEETKDSVVEQLYQNELHQNKLFDNLFFSHPAIFMVEYSLAQVLLEQGIIPDAVLGYSLGEFTAAAVAGVINYKEALISISKQVAFLEQFCPKGGMLAVMEHVGFFYDSPILYENSEMASINYHSHFVISGSVDKLDTIEKYLKSEKILFQRLPVPYAFHSSRMESIHEYYKNFSNSIVLKKPKIDYFSCLTKGKITDFSAEHFWQVIRKPVDFQSTIVNFENKEDLIYIDLGPSGTLSNFMKYNLLQYETKRFSIMNPIGSDKSRLEKLISFAEKNKIQKKERVEEKMKAYVFPGQGAQFKGMGRELFQEFSEHADKADKILGYSIRELCLEDPRDELGITNFTQPALYVVNALYYLKLIRDTGNVPNYVAGHSLGEYDALFASGVFDFETGLMLVKKRGELMSRAAGGGMAAVMGLNEEKVREILERNGLNQIEMANLNTPSQIVISGLKAEILSAKQVFESEGAKAYIPLKVSGAFHSRFMEEAEHEFAKFMEPFQFHKMEIPVISNVYARPYQFHEIKSTLLKQITHSVKWTETIRYLMGKDVNEIVQVGPGKTLTGLVSTIQREALPLTLYEDRIDLKVSEKKSVLEFNGASLGSDAFKKDYALSYAYVIGAMYKGISSEELVIRAGKAGLLAFYGAGGLSITQVGNAVTKIQEELGRQGVYGVNMTYQYDNSDREEAMVDLLLRRKVSVIEASGYMTMTKALVLYRLAGLRRDERGRAVSSNRIVAKISRPETALIFLSPAPESIVTSLWKENQITEEQKLMAGEIPMADDICAEADSGGHTDQRSAFALMPAIIKLRDEITEQYQYKKVVRVGAAGGIGTPQAAAAAFLLGADFIMTGSVNQCTAEAQTSNLVKDMLLDINVQDTAYTVAGDLFELGSKIQVLKKGVFFPARANKLFELYRQYSSIDDIDTKTLALLEEKYFKKSIDQIYREIKENHSQEEIERMERNQKSKMAAIFKWYFNYSFQLALLGEEENSVDFQVHCGSALGAFNQWCKGTSYENWRDRHVDEIGIEMMEQTAKYLENQLKNIV